MYKATKKNSGTVSITKEGTSVSYNLKLFGVSEFEINEILKDYFDEDPVSYLKLKIKEKNNLEVDLIDDENNEVPTNDTDEALFINDENFNEKILEFKERFIENKNLKINKLNRNNSILKCLLNFHGGFLKSLPSYLTSSAFEQSLVINGEVEEFITTTFRVLVFIPVPGLTKLLHGKTPMIHELFHVIQMDYLRHLDELYGIELSKIILSDKFVSLTLFEVGACTNLSSVDKKTVIFVKEFIHTYYKIFLVENKDKTDLLIKKLFQMAEIFVDSLHGFQYRKLFTRERREKNLLSNIKSILLYLKTE